MHVIVIDDEDVATTRAAYVLGCMLCGACLVFVLFLLWLLSGAYRQTVGGLLVGLYEGITGETDPPTVIMRPCAVYV